MHKAIKSSISSVHGQSWLPVAKQSVKDPQLTKMEFMEMTSSEVIFNFFNDLLKSYCPLHLVIFTSITSFLFTYIYQELTYKVSRV